MSSYPTVAYSNFVKNELDQNVAPALEANTQEIQNVQNRVNTAENDIVAHDGRLAQNENDISLQGGRLDTAETDIGSLQTKDIEHDGRIGTNENAITVHDGRLDSAENDITVHTTRLDTAEADVGALQTKDVEHDNKLADRLADLEAMLSAVIVEVEPPSSSKLRDLSGNYLIFNTQTSKYEFSGAQESDGVSIDFIPGSEGGYLLGDSTNGDFIRANGDALTDTTGVPKEEYTFRVCYTTKVSGESRLALRHYNNATDFMGRSVSSATFELSPDSERAVRI